MISLMYFFVSGLLYAMGSTALDIVSDLELSFLHHINNCKTYFNNYGIAYTCFLIVICLQSYVFGFFNLPPSPF